MKASKLIVGLTVMLFLQSCSDKVKGDKRPVRDMRAIQSWEVRGRDTVNRTNFAGEKQGYWVVTKFVAVTKTIQATYTGETGTHTKVTKDVDVVKIAEGMYLDNKKEGLWKSFFPDGKIKHSVIYKNYLALKK